MTNRRDAIGLEEVVEEYVASVRKELAARWEKWARTLTELEKYEVVGGLLARQVTLATQLARAPAIWNAHIAPVLLRSMVDTYIAIAWVLRDPVPRARQFILYGLGQHKLYLEHLKAATNADDAEAKQGLAAIEGWLNSQRFTFLTEVNLGSWSDINARKMAEEVGELELYNLSYSPFSAATHSMWQHVGRLNLIECESPLHRYHRIPIDPDIAGDIDYLALHRNV